MIFIGLNYSRYRTYLQSFYRFYSTGLATRCWCAAKVPILALRTCRGEYHNKFVHQMQIQLLQTLILIWSISYGKNRDVIGLGNIYRK